jgi:hypothetical protein
VAASALGADDLLYFLVPSTPAPANVKAMATSFRSAGGSSGNVSSGSVANAASTAATAEASIVVARAICPETAGDCPATTIAGEIGAEPTADVKVENDRVPRSPVAKSLTLSPVADELAAGNAKSLIAELSGSTAAALTTGLMFITLVLLVVIG